MISQTCPITHFSKVSGHRPALYYDGNWLSYRELDRKIDELSPPFKAGTVVPFFPKGLLEDILFFFALYRRQIIPFPLSFRQPMSRLKSLVTQTASIYDDQAATYIATSGSTGEPKIARLSFANHIKSALGVIELLKITSDDRFLLSLPLFHVGGLSLLFRAFLAGASLILPSVDTITTIAREKPTRLSLVPYQLKKILQKRIDLSSCRSLLLGGQSLPPALCAQALSLNIPLVTSYGMTEMASMITGHPLCGPFSLGHPLPFRFLKIGENSEVFVRGETLFLGYAGHSPLKEGEWFPTGDLGSLDEHGLLIRGRRDRQFISGGENIHPEEIERALLSLGQIFEAKVIPIEDPDFGHRPKAFIRPFSNPEMIQKKLLTLLPKYMIPISFEPLQEATKLSGDL